MLCNSNSVFHIYQNTLAMYNTVVYQNKEICIHSECRISVGSDKLDVVTTIS